MAAYYIDALMMGGNWGGNIGQSVNISYTFNTASPLGQPQQAATLAGLQAWANVANVTFTAVNAGADISFSEEDLSQWGGAAGLTNTWGQSFNSSTELYAFDIALIKMDSDVIGNHNYDRGDFGYMALIHEIGHALGLDHPGSYGGSSSNSPILPAGEDTYHASLMSYHSGPLVNAANYSTGPMIYDIAAIQYLYGANHNYNAGNTTVAINGSKQAYALWDGAGSDTLDASSYSGSSTIDLREGLNNITVIGQSVLWMAFGANIENAVGGAGANTITGNSLGNDLYGMGGSDVLDGQGGDDVLFGGANGADPFDGGDTLSGGEGGDLIYGNGGNDLIYGRSVNLESPDGADLVFGGQGVDTVYGNEGADSLYGGGSGFNPIEDGDIVYGGAGNDFLFGNGGRDTLIGGAGNDELSGGFSSDLFVFGAGSGDDVIVKFHDDGINEDVIQLASNVNGSGIFSASDVLSHITYSGGDAIIDIGGGNSITLLNVNFGALTANDFLVG